MYLSECPEKIHNWKTVRTDSWAWTKWIRWYTKIYIGTTFIWFEFVAIWIIDISIVSESDKSLFNYTFRDGKIVMLLQHRLKECMQKAIDSLRLNSDNSDKLMNALFAYLQLQMVYFFVYPEKSEISFFSLVNESVPFHILFLDLLSVFLR
jgi:hypothetical protein